jgi:dTDP-4-dehydrorhamnose reductase
MNQKKILITGIWGMLGFNLASTLKNKLTIFGCDRITGYNYPYIQSASFDLMDSDKTRSYIQQINPKIIIHTAALINVDYCEENQEQAFLVNAEVTKQIALAASKTNSKLVYISTDAVFDGQKDSEYSENDTPSPINIYGESKLTGEKYIKDILNDYLIIRTNIYGWNIQFKNSFTEWIFANLTEKKPINMFYDITFSPIYVGCLSSIIKEMLEKNLTGLFNVASSESCSKYDFGIKLAHTFDLPENLINQTSFSKFPFKAKRSKNMRLNVDKISAILKKKMPSIQEGLDNFKKEMSQYRRKDGS